MAEYSVARPQMTFPIPDGLDDAVAAAAWNPGLSAWLAFGWRCPLQPGATVLILGATGVTGKLAVQAARHFGAGRVVAAGRNQQVLDLLPQLGADAGIQLGQPDDALAAAFAAQAGEGGYDLVIDYLWGHPAEVFLTSIGHNDAQPPVRTDPPAPGRRYGRPGHLAASSRPAQRGPGDPRHGHRHHAADGRDHGNAA